MSVGRDQVTPLPSLRKSVPEGCLIVAQYEVLGNDAMKTSPSPNGRSKRQALVARNSASAITVRSSCPGRLPIKTVNPALRTGLLSNVPAGLIPSAPDQFPACAEIGHVLGSGSRRI